MVQKQLSDRELEALKKSLQYYFGMNKEYQNEYAGFFKKLYSSKVLSEVVREKCEEYKTTKKWPTAEEIESAYWRNIRKEREPYKANCQMCGGSGTLVAVENAQGLIDWRSGIKALNDIATVVMNCPCPHGSNKMKEPEKDMYPQDLRARIAHKYSFGSTTSKDVYRRADAYVSACCNMKNKTSNKEPKAKSSDNEFNERVRGSE
jgi:hypothetical protein